jgi:hypothetical protein
MADTIDIDTIRGLVRRVNAEYGLSDKNEVSERWFWELRDRVKFVIEDWGYLVYSLAEDMWGDREFHVVSFWIAPEKRSAGEFIRLQGMIERRAREQHCRYVIQGSHLNKKLYSWLEKAGYRKSSMKKELL